MDFTATDTAQLTNISVRSINSIFIKIRRKIALKCEQVSPFNGVVELDEFYFGTRRVRGKRGRGASGKGHNIRWFSWRKSKLCYVLFILIA